MRERSLRVRSQLVEEIYNQTEITNKQDNVEAPSFSMRARNLVSNSINSDFSYRPDYEWEGGFVLEVGRTEDFSRLSVPTANVNSQTFRLTYSIPLYGQFRAQVSREEVRVVNATIDPLKPFVYEFTAGKTVGKSFLWQINLDYRIGQNVQLSLYYNGRTEGGREPIHLARMEARAFF